MPVQKRMKPLLGTFVEIGLETNDALNTSFNAAFSEIERIQNLMSFHNPKSELSALNKNPCEWVTVSPETLEVMTHAKWLGEQSDGRFNPTCGGALIEQRVLPNHFLHRFESQGTCQDIELGDQQLRINNYVLITLDGIAKGYAVDRAATVLKKQGIQAGWINAGGDLLVFGELELPVALRQNHQADTQDLPIYKLKNQAMATSHVGLPVDENFPGHILNANGHAPEPAQVSIIADQAWLADGLTKVLGLADDKARKKLSDQFKVSYHVQPYMQPC